MRKILVPIDFSKEAEYAAKVAAKIAENSNSELHLLHLLELPTDMIDPSNYGNASNSPTTLLYMKKAQELFEKLTKRYFLRNVTIVKSVVFSNSYEGIIAESIKRNVDLIVMGSKGISGFSEILVGSTTEKVVRNADVPVIVVKNEIDDFKLENIVFASDFNEYYKKGFDRLVEFANKFDAKVHLLCISTPNGFKNSFDSKQTIQKFIEGTGIKDYTINTYNDKTVESGVLHFGQEINADLIAINTHRRKGLAHLFNNSISGSIANHAIRPVITFRL